MTTLYVQQKALLTAFKALHQSTGQQVYRTRLHCNCSAPNNRRDGLLIIKNNTLIQRVVRCKACYKTETP